MSSFDTPLRRALGIDFPLIVAPMAGGPTTVDLVVAASEAGALGSLAGAYRSAASIADDVQAIRSKTRKPFAINLFVPTPFSQPSEEKVKQAILTTRKFRDEFRLPPPLLSEPFQDDFDEQFEAVLKIKPAVFSFIFGVPSRERLREARERGIFDAAAEDPGIGTLDLLRALKGKIRIPLIARGVINRFMTEMEASPEAVLPFPVQNKFTRDLRNASAAADSPDCLSLWSGTGEGDLFTGSAVDLIHFLLRDAFSNFPEKAPK